MKNKTLPLVSNLCPTTSPACTSESLFTAGRPARAFAGNPVHPAARAKFRLPGSLLSVAADAKTVKGAAAGVLTGILYLAPGTLAGVGNLCPHASAGCAAAGAFCLALPCNGPPRSARGPRLPYEAAGPPGVGVDLAKLQRAATGPPACLARAGPVRGPPGRGSVRGPPCPFDVPAATDPPCLVADGPPGRSGRALDRRPRFRRIGSRIHDRGGGVQIFSGAWAAAGGGNRPIGKKFRAEAFRIHDWWPIGKSRAEVKFFNLRMDLPSGNIWKQKGAKVGITSRAGTLWKHDWPEVAH